MHYNSIDSLENRYYGQILKKTSGVLGQWELLKSGKRLSHTTILSIVIIYIGIIFILNFYYIILSTVYGTSSSYRSVGFSELIHVQVKYVYIIIRDNKHNNIFITNTQAS